MRIICSRTPSFRKRGLVRTMRRKRSQRHSRRIKKTGLFDGLDALHKKWGELSETGAHATINAVSQRYIQTQDAEGINFRWNYCGLGSEAWALEIFAMVPTFFEMEKTLSSDYDDRLKLDDALLRMRQEFEVRKETLRRKLIRRFNLKPPPSPLIVNP